MKIEINILHVVKDARTRKNKKIDVTVRLGKTFVQLTADTDIPSLFLNMTTVMIFDVTNRDKKLYIPH